MAIIWLLGAKGFIGQHLARQLAMGRNTLLGLGHGAWPEEELQKVGLEYWHNGDIDSANLAHLAQRRSMPDVIYHAGGGGSVAVSLSAPLEDFQRSVGSTAALLEWVRNYAPRSRVVILSSAAVYGNSDERHLLEEGAYTPFSPYGSHKRMVEILCESYATNFGLSISIVRLFSIYGSGLKKQLLWDVCNRLSAGVGRLELHGTGRELRDWLHVSDAALILQAAGSVESAAFQIVNGGTGTGTPVCEIVEWLCDAWGSRPEIVFSGKRRSGDPVDLVADVSHLRSLYGLDVTMPLQKGLENYVNWFRGRCE